LVISKIPLYFIFFINARGSELAPGKESLRNEAIPKSALRVLNAKAIRDGWNLKKRKLEDEDGKDGPGGKRRKTTGSGNEEKSRNLKKISPTIQPWESIQHFNRSVLARISSLKLF
jgi:hypothetical protein